MEETNWDEILVFIGLVPAMILLLIVALGVLKEQALYNFYNWVYVVFGVSIGKYFTFGVYKLQPHQQNYLSKKIKYYRLLKHVDRKQFNHRVRKFIKHKEFIGREGLEVTEEMKLLVAAKAVMCSFGLAQYELYSFTKILLYPEEYYSRITKNYHKGEVNPRGIIVFSWHYFEEGIADEADNLNLGIHEFAHAYLHEAEATIDNEDVFGEPSIVHNVLRLKDLFINRSYKEKLKEINAVRDYAFTNYNEFFAVACEYFFETPKQLKQNAPDLYCLVSRMLNQDTAKLLL